VLVKIIINLNEAIKTIAEKTSKLESTRTAKKVRSDAAFCVFFISVKTNFRALLEFTSIHIIFKTRK